MKNFLFNRAIMLKFKLSVVLSFFTWEKFLKFAKIVEVLAIIVGASAIVALPFQIRDLKNSYNKNHFDVLWQLESRLREIKNNEIFYNIYHGKTIYTNDVTEDDLDLYLIDLESIEDAYQKGLITLDEAYEWFDFYITETANNTEVREYIIKNRKDCPDCYAGLDELAKEFNKMH